MQKLSLEVFYILEFLSKVEINSAYPLEMKLEISFEKFRFILCFESTIKN